MSPHETSTVKVIELVGESSESWEDAAEQALRDASETIDEISGVAARRRVRGQPDRPVPVDRARHLPDPAVRVSHEGIPSWAPPSY